jgi:hypothetical protein
MLASRVRVSTAPSCGWIIPASVNGIDHAVPPCPPRRVEIAGIRTRSPALSIQEFEEFKRAGGVCVMVNLPGL